MTGFDGILAMSAPEPVFDAAPAAVPFTRAIGACEGPLTIVQDSPTKITVKAGGFRASVPCLPVDKIPTVRPEGNFGHKWYSGRFSRFEAVHFHR